MYRIVFSKTAAKQRALVKQAGLENKVKALLNLIAEDPFRTPPPCEKLLGDLEGLFSRRINIKHRLVYHVVDEENAVHIVSMWTHYEY